MNVASRLGSGRHDSRELPPHSVVCVRINCSGCSRSSLTLSAIGLPVAGALVYPSLLPTMLTFQPSFLNWSRRGLRNLHGAKVRIGCGDVVEGTIHKTKCVVEKGESSSKAYLLVRTLGSSFRSHYWELVSLIRRHLHEPWEISAKKLSHSRDKVAPETGKEVDMGRKKMEGTVHPTTYPLPVLEPQPATMEAPRGRMRR